MLVFDIDDTISPTDRDHQWTTPYETKLAWGFNVSIPTYVLDFLRSRDDIAFLSTWGKAAQQLADAFGINAVILVMTEDQIGVSGKFDVVSNRDDITAWVDDHIKPAMAKNLRERGITVIKPKGGHISEKDIEALGKL